VGKKRILNISGKTEDGRLVVAGLFTLNDTHGFPLEASLLRLKDANMVMDVLDYFSNARKAGWKYDKTKLRLMEAVLGTYGPEFWAVIERHLSNNYIEEGWHDRTY
jgi:alanyl-tRNA synthetase